MKEEYLRQDQLAINDFEREVQILSGLNHKNIVRILDYGKEGLLIKKNGSFIDGLVYIMMEYVEGGSMFDIVNNLEGIGEDGARHFLC